MGNQPAVIDTGWCQIMMAATAGTVEGELGAILLGRGGPVIGFGIDGYVVQNVACPCNGFCHEELDEIPVR